MDKENLLRQIGVYTITSPSGKKYVGMTAAQSFKDRWKQHKKLLRGNHHICAGLQNAFNKYGFEGLSFEIVKSYEKPAEQDTVLTKLIQAEEIRFWEIFKSEGVKLYNGCPTGTGSVHHTEETRAKIGKAISSKNLAQKPIEKECVYCLSNFLAKSHKAKYCSERCRSHFIKTGMNSMKFSIYPTFNEVQKQLAFSKDVTILAKVFGIKESDMKFFIIDKYGLCSTIERQILAGRKRVRSTSRSDKIRVCLMCKNSFVVINNSTAEYCSSKCRKDAYHQKTDYTQKPSKELLKHLYIDEGFSTTQIAEKLNCTQPNVYYLLKKFGIPTRNKNRNNRKVP